MKLKILIILGFLLGIFNYSIADEKINDVSIYTGTFDVIDKEGDDKTTLFGVEHKKP